MHLLLDQLDNMGFLQGNEPNLAKIGRAKLVELGDLIKESAILTSAEDIPRATGIFEYSVARDLGGGDEPCAGWDCRVRRTEELARFSALYADKVYIHNFLADRVHALTSTNLSLYELRRDIATDLTIVGMLRPLIENDIIIPITPPRIKCSICFALENFGDTVGDSFLQADVDLTLRFLDEAEMSVVKHRNGYRVHVRAPDDLIEHGNKIYFFKDCPQKLKRHKRLFERVQNGETVTLTQNQARQWGLYQMLASRIVHHTVLDICMSQAIGSSYVTNSQLHIDMLNTVSKDLAMSRRNKIVAKHLTSIVPIAAEVPIQHLVTLRKREEDAFILFRHALNQTIDNYKSSGNTLSEGDARAIYSEFIAPGLAQLNRRVSMAKKGLAAAIRGKVSAISAALSFGGFAGLGPQGALGAAQTLGLGTASTALAEQLGGWEGTSNSIEAESLYFLWKLKQSHR